MQSSRTVPRAPSGVSRAIVTSRWAALGWAGVIFLASSLPGSSVPGRFGTLAHFLEYAVLGALLIGALGGRRRDAVGVAVAAIALSAAWGATDELHQAFVPLRVPDAIDWLVDTGGAAVGATVTTAILFARSRRASNER